MYSGSPPNGRLVSQLGALVGGKSREACKWFAAARSERERVKYCYYYLAQLTKQVETKQPIEMILGRRTNNNSLKMAPTNWQLVAFIGFFAPLCSSFPPNTYNNKQTKTFPKGELCLLLSFYLASSLSQVVASKKAGLECCPICIALPWHPSTSSNRDWQQQQRMKTKTR